MFKLEESSCETYGHVGSKARAEDVGKKKGIALANKATPRSMEENKPNSSNRRKIDATSSDSRTNSQKEKGYVNKGIHVLSSRQSSLERRPLATSRSRQKLSPKQSREIKSQANVSPFYSQTDVKEPSIEDPPLSKAQLQTLCHAFEMKLSQAIMRNQAASRDEAEQLRDIINSNEQRINNLIYSLNVMIEKSQRKESMIQRLQERLQSLHDYHEQCYDYTVRRCSDVQNIMRVVAEEVDNAKGTGGRTIINMMETVDSFVKEIFTIQRYKYNQLTYDTGRETEKITAKVVQLESQVQFLEGLYGSREHLKDRQGQLEEYLAYMSNELFKNKISLNHSSGGQQGPTSSEGTHQLKSIILSLSTKLEDIDSQKTQLQKTYLFNEQTAQETIRQLSNLLNKHERQLESKSTELEAINKYNKEIQNRLIESKLRENSQRIEMESHCKSIETSKNNLYDELYQEKDCFKERFQDLFRHNQYVQEVNCKNKIMMMQHEKEMQEERQEMDRGNEEYRKLKTQVEVKEEYWKNQVKLEILTFESSIRSLKEQTHRQGEIISENSKQILNLELKCLELSEEKTDLQEQAAKIRTQLDGLNGLKAEYREEQLYSEHLESENEILTSSLNQYKGIFNNQSSMFKSTINQLKQENHELHKNLDVQSEKLFAGQPKKYESRPALAKPKSNDESRLSRGKELSSRLTELQDVFCNLQLQMPVPCQLDPSGCLKSQQKGTYLSFQLSPGETKFAIANNIIKLFQ